MGIVGTPHFRKSIENLLGYAEPKCTWKQGERFRVTVRKGDRLRNDAVVLRSLRPQHRRHGTGSMLDFRPLWTLRRRLRKWRTIIATFAASRGRNSIDRERRAAKPRCITEHARKARRRVRSLGWRSITSRQRKTYVRALHQVRTVGLGTLEGKS